MTTRAPSTATAAVPTTDQEVTDEPPPVEGRVPKGVMPRSLRLAKPWNRSAPPRTAPVVGHPDEIAPHSPRLALRDLQVPKALQHPPFRRFWSGQLVALIGMWGQSTASNLVFLTLTSSAFLIGLINIVSAVPMLLLSLFGGVIADRFERRKILTMTQTVIASLSVVWAILIFTDRIAYWHVLVIAAVGGVVVSFDLPAGQAFLSQIVRREDMTEAIALNSASINATRIFGPILAGILIGVVGTGVAFVAHSTAVMIFVITIFSLRAMVPHSRPVGSRVPGITALRDGLRHIRHSDELIGLVGVTAIFSFLAVPPLLVLMSLYVTKTLGGSDAWVPTMTSIFGAGSLIAAIALFRGSRLEAAAGRRMRLTMAGLAVGLMWLALAPNPWLAIPGILIAGCSFEMGLIQVQTRVQALAPDDLRGRVLSVNGLAFNGVMPFSTLTISTATTELGAPLVLGACSVLVAICSVLIWKRYTWKAFVPAPAI